MPVPTSPDASSEAPSLSSQLDDLTRLFRALSDPVRLRILLLVAERERNVTSLCHATGLAQPTVSHHLGLLRSSALAIGRRDGKAIYYSSGKRLHVEGTDTIALDTGDAPCSQVRVRVAAGVSAAPTPGL
jgi:ArsR family transcriptional regulator